MKVTITPSRAAGTMMAPPSKSMAHRLLICSGLADGESIITNVDPSQDILATIDCLKALGADIRYEDRTVTIHGIDPVKAKSAVLPCRECGSTLRFFIPICLLSGEPMELSGSRTLLSRPLSVYEKLCREQGIPFERDETTLRTAGVLTPGSYTIPGNISSQFISGLLFALPLLSEDSSITITPPVESLPYIQMTLEALAAFGIKADWKDSNVIRIPGGQKYQPRNLAVEGDYSNAAFFEALNLLGGDVQLTGLRPDSLQGDSVYQTYFPQLAQKAPVLDISDCPDLGPILLAMAALLNGAHFIGTARLAIKECNRGLAMKEELKKLGVDLLVSDNTITVPKVALQPPAEVINGHNDHRIVMAMAIALTALGGSIEGAQAIRKSLPDFFDRISALGIGVSYDELDQ